VIEHVPPPVLERHTAFSACVQCGRVYWEGTPMERIKGFVDEPLARITDAPGPPDRGLRIARSSPRARVRRRSS